VDCKRFRESERAKIKKGKDNLEGQRTPRGDVEKKFVLVAGRLGLLRVSTDRGREDHTLVILGEHRKAMVKRGRRVLRNCLSVNTPASSSDYRRSRNIGSDEEQEGVDAKASELHYFLKGEQEGRKCHICGGVCESKELC